MDELLSSSIEAVTRLFRQGHPCAVGFSAGKDSSVVQLIALAAARQALAEGLSPQLIVLHANTGVENPENVHYAKEEISKVLDFGQQHGIDVRAAIAMPSMARTWAMRIIGGTALPSFPGGNHDCSVEWKIKPMQRMRKALFRDLKDVVTLIGTRYEESEARAQRMRERNESAIEPQRNKEGDLIMAPIADWTTDEVWEALATAQGGLLDSYSDFKETFRLYADGGGTSCAIVSDMAMSSKPKNGCGSRFGCWSCVAVSKDESMTNMIQGDPRYAYMNGLAQLRNFIVATRWDMDRRQWIGRSIDDQGRIAIAPDVYSPKMLQELLRYSLTLDQRERERAARVHEAPRFEIVSIEALIAIDANWSLRGYHPPHTALADWNAIVNHGVRYDVPRDMAEFPKPSPMPQAQYLEVGPDWADVLGDYAGLRDAALEMVGDTDALGCMGVRILGNGLMVMDVNTEAEFQVDPEGAELALMFELDRLLEAHENYREGHGITAGYRNWLRLGTISLAPNQVAQHDDILRRTVLKEELGLVGPDVDVDALLAQLKPKAAGRKLGL